MEKKKLLRLSIAIWEQEFAPIGSQLPLIGNSIGIGMDAPASPISVDLPVLCFFSGAGFNLENW